MSWWGEGGHLFSGDSERKPTYFASRIRFPINVFSEISMAAQCPLQPLHCDWCIFRSRPLNGQHKEIKKTAFSFVTQRHSFRLWLSKRNSCDIDNQEVCWDISAWNDRPASVSPLRQRPPQRGRTTPGSLPGSCRMRGRMPCDLPALWRQIGHGVHAAEARKKHKCPGTTRLLLGIYQY